MSDPVSRRNAIATLAAALALPALPRFLRGVRHASARLQARPHPPRQGIAAGKHPLGLGQGRDGLLLVPGSYRPDKAATLIVGLHGATGSSAGFTVGALPLVEKGGAILLAPDSRGITWDAIRGDYGPDVAFIDRALEWTFSRCRIDPARVFVAGFSDGASYALGLGTQNGGLFSRIMAFSPGFMPYADEPAVGRPRVFVSHGTRDTILPIDRTSRTLVPALQRAGYEVSYQEFDGPHTVPPAMVEAAVTWMGTG